MTQKYTGKEIFTKSNLISIFRLLLAVPLWPLLDNLNAPGNRQIIIAICIIAAISDSLDGYLARKYNEITELGKIIDPLADKVLVAAIIVKLYLTGEIPGYFFFMVIGRDVLIFIGGMIVAKILGRVLPSNVLGKMTVSSIGVLILLIIGGLDRANIIYISIYYLSIILIVASFLGYLIRAIEFVRHKDHGTVQ